MIAVAVRNIDGRKVLPTGPDPIREYIVMVGSQECVDENRISLTIDES